jgi:hypothetical protein
MGACDASKLDELNQAVKASSTYFDYGAVRVVPLGCEWCGVAAVALHDRTKHRDRSRSLGTHVSNWTYRIFPIAQFVKRSGAEYADQQLVKNGGGAACQVLQIIR